MYVSLKDVAARAGVSFQTAGKVLNGGAGSVSDDTRRRIQAAADELGYVPNALARSLITRSTLTIGVIVDDLTDWSVTQFVVGAERAARRRGHALLIGAARPSGDGDTPDYAQQLLERRVDGMVSVAPRLEDDEGLAAVLRGPVPTVSIHHVPGGGVPVVGSAHSGTGRLVATHLYDLGHRRIGVVTGPRRRRVVASRLRGFREQLGAAGVRIEARHVEESDWTAAGGHAATLALLDRDPTITAIAAHSDLMAIGVLAALRESGRQVPADCAVVGCDDLPFAGYLSPALSTVHIPFAETGERAVSLLLDVLAGNDPTGPYLLPVHLVERASTVGARTPERITIDD